MRRFCLGLLPGMLLLATGCTLSRATATPQVVTATLSILLAMPESGGTEAAQPIQSPESGLEVIEVAPVVTLSPTAAPDSDATIETLVIERMTGTAAVWTFTPLPTATATVTITPTTTPTVTPTVTFTPTVTPLPILAAVSAPTDTLPVPTQLPVEWAAVPSATLDATVTPSPEPPTLSPAPSAPPTAVPLDDGSGGVVPDSGSGPVVLPVPGVEALPDTLYYLSDQGNPEDRADVWRLRLGLTQPQRLTSSAAGVLAFSVAPDGTFSYVTGDGVLMTGGMSVPVEAGADGVAPRVVALAWSPGGDWLAYVTQTPDAGAGARRSHPVDGVWIRNRDGRAVFLQPNVYPVGSESEARIYTGPIDWRPNGTEFLVGLRLGGEAYVVSRIDITTGTASPVWNAGALAPGTYAAARWSINANAIITSGAGQVLRIEPDTLGVQVLLPPDSRLWPTDAQQLADGTLVAVAAEGDSGGPAGLYTLTPGQVLPQASVTSAEIGDLCGVLWSPDGPLLLLEGASDSACCQKPWLLQPGGEVIDLTPLTGPVGSPQWGPLFQSGDAARVHTTEGDMLNVRETPNGLVLIQLPNRSRVLVVGDTRVAGDYRWWRIQTPDGVTGWVVESVIGSDGLRQRTLLPVE